MQHEKIRQAGDSAPDVAELRRVLGSFATGVAVATTFDSKGVFEGLHCQFLHIGLAQSSTSPALWRIFDMRPDRMIDLIDPAERLHGCDHFR